MGLQEFLSSEALLHVRRPSRPRVSVLIVLYNRAELTLLCLRSLLPYLEHANAELVLVDNNSHDETALLLDRLRGPILIRNDENRGFPAAVNQAAAAASGEFLLMLNNDTEIVGDGLGAGQRFLAAHPDVGAVGGRITLLDGTLQEAGCTLLRDSHPRQYGRGEDPNSPPYLFQRDVDYCSGALLMTRRELFLKMGGLDMAYSPGYYEDPDYCVRLWRAGWRVVYLPELMIRHYENASFSSGSDVVPLMLRNHSYFNQKHADWLSWQCPADCAPLAQAHFSHDDRFRVLYPTYENTPGLGLILRRLASMHCFVTVYLIDSKLDWSREELPELPADMEVFPGSSLDTLAPFLASRRQDYDCVLAGDPKIAARVRRALTPKAAEPDWFSSVG